MQEPITEVKEAEDNLAALKQEHQKNITLSTILAQEAERTRISTALHNSLGQLLYGIKMQVDLLNNEQASPIIKKIYELLETAVTETRNIAFELAPSILTDFGLTETINELARRLSTPQLKIKTGISGLANRLDADLELCVFRIVQELVNNCIKHAGASIIELFLIQTTGIEITVHDNGKGFKISSQTVSIGTGLSSIKTRIALYNGTLDIQSLPNKGTIVIVKLQY